MSFKWMPKAAVALVGLTLVAPSAQAQAPSSMFDQMPETPAEQPAAAATTPAGPSRMTLPEASAAPAPANVAPMFDSSQQASGPGAECHGIQKTLEQRKALVAKANAASNSKKKMTPAQACTLFNQLQANGAAGVKWIKAHKESCSIPDAFSDGFAADHGKVSAIKVKVCTAAVQYSKMEAQAREQAQNGGGGLLGGPGLTGSFKMPQGAL